MRAYRDVNWETNPPPSLLDQCVVEQEYVRQSMTRTLLYAQVRRPPTLTALTFLPWNGVNGAMGACDQ